MDKLRFLIIILVSFLVLRTDSFCRDVEDLSGASSILMYSPPTASPTAPLDPRLGSAPSEAILPEGDVDVETALGKYLEAIGSEARLQLQNRKRFDGYSPELAAHRALLKATSHLSVKLEQWPDENALTSQIDGYLDTIRDAALTAARQSNFKPDDKDDTESFVRGTILGADVIQFRTAFPGATDEASFATFNQQLRAALNRRVEWQGQAEGVLSLRGELRRNDCCSLFVLEHGIGAGYSALGSFSTATISCGFIMGSLGEILDISGSWTTAAIIIFMVTHAPSEYETHAGIWHQLKRLFCCKCRRPAAEKAFHKERTPGHTAARISVHLLNLSEAGAWTAVAAHVMADWPFFYWVASPLFGLSALAAGMRVSQEEMDRHFGGKRDSDKRIQWFTLHHGLRKLRSNHELAILYDRIFSSVLEPAASTPHAEQKLPATADYTQLPSQPLFTGQEVMRVTPEAAQPVTSIVALFGESSGEHLHVGDPSVVETPDKTTYYRVFVDRQHKSHLNWQGRGKIGVVLLALPGWMIALGAGATLIRPELMWLGYGVGILFGAKTWSESRFYERTLDSLFTRSSLIPGAWSLIPAAGFGAFPACLVILSGQTIGWGWIPVGATCVTQFCKKLYVTTHQTAGFAQRCWRWGWNSTKRKAAVMRGYLKAAGQLLNDAQDVVIQQITAHVIPEWHIE